MHPKVLEARSPKSRHQQGWASSKSCRGKYFFASPFLAVAGVSAYFHIASSLCVCLRLLLFLLVRYQSWNLKLTLNPGRSQPKIFNYISKILFGNKVICTVLGHIFLRIQLSQLQSPLPVDFHMDPYTISLCSAFFIQNNTFRNV